MSHKGMFTHGADYRAPQNVKIQDQFKEGECTMKMLIEIDITPEQYLQSEALSRKMRMPTDKAVGKIVSFHIPSILANTHVEAPAGPKPIDWGAFK